MTAGEPLILLVLALAGTFLLRALGVVGAGHLDQKSALFRWVGCVAFAIAAGIMAKILVLPSGVLADAALAARLGGVALGVAIFFLAGRRILFGLGGGLAAFLVTDLWWVT